MKKTWGWPNIISVEFELYQHIPLLRYMRTAKRKNLFAFTGYGFLSVQFHIWKRTLNLGAIRLFIGKPSLKPLFNVLHVRNIQG